VQKVKNILEMNKLDLLSLIPQDYARTPLSAEEVIHVAATMDAFWRYDYKAAKQGRVGKHALLKSGLHSDGFLVSKILLEPYNIRLLMAYQLWLCFKKLSLDLPDYLIGVPDGATKLAEDLGGIMGVEVIPMFKIDGRIMMSSIIFHGRWVLMVEDFCTKGTGFKEAVTAIIQDCSYANFVNFMPYELVLVNRGGLKKIEVDDVGDFAVVPIVDYRIQEWQAGPETCPLCKMGSIAIKPKVSEESWKDITTSQL